MNPLTLPPRLLLRALDDLHSIAGAAQSLPAIEARLVERFDALEQRANAIEQQLAAALQLGDRIEARGGEVVDAADRAERLGRELLAQGEIIAQRAEAVATSGAELAAALPTLERAVEMTTPLEGAVERLGRFVDRLPGGGAGRR